MWPFKKRRPKPIWREIKREFLGFRMEDFNNPSSGRGVGVEVDTYAIYAVTYQNVLCESETYTREESSLEFF